MVFMPQPVLGNQVLQDTFEKLGDQVQDTVQGLKDLVTGGNDKTGGDSGIEQLSVQNDPNQNQKQQQGLSSQDLAQRRVEEQEKVKFHREQIEKWGEDYKQMKEENMAEQQKKDKEEKKKEEQKIFQLQEQDARSATLNPVKPKTAKGPGSAFAARSTKSQTEFSKTPTN